MPLGAALTSSGQESVADYSLLHLPTTQRCDLSETPNGMEPQLPTAVTG